jgi:predicted chitinase
MTDVETSNALMRREQITVLVRDTKWLILASIVFSALLLLPDQILELYRITYSDKNISDFLYLHLPIIVIGASVWFACLQIAAETRRRVASPTRAFLIAAVGLPVLLGVLPIVASAFGLLNAVPTRLPSDQDATSLVGAIWGPMEIHFTELAQHLRNGAVTQLVLAGLFAAVAWWSTTRLEAFSARLSASHLGRRSGIALAILFIVAVSAAFYFMPVWLPRRLGVFAVVAIFAICVLAFTTNFTLLGIRYRFPFMALACLPFVVLSLGNVNDNHAIRLLSGSDKATLKAADERTVAAEFKHWLEKRPDKASYPDGYPVYIVSAQGGGLYAAYQSAIFLARLQDLCPAFRHHLFAMSSVSGGSIGGATFVTALSSLDKGLLEIDAADQEQSRNLAAGSFDPCPAIRAFQSSAVLPSNPERAGPLERAVRRTLREDFISPLAAAFLLTDFTQRFLPRTFDSLDRARALEEALESSIASIMKPTATTAEKDNNPFAASFLNLWSADGSSPALLINATDAGSGRRFVVSPFKLGQPQPQNKLGATLNYTFWDDKLPSSDQARDLRLSTAAFISARFPWITPAATIKDSRSALDQTMKLVDGGYVDNSGVETLLDLHNEIAPVAKELKAKLNLVVLSGGDFPLRKSFSFGEVMEPLRALLSTRSSRAYVAVDRAALDFQPFAVVKDYSFKDEKLSVFAPTLKKAWLDNRFYELPLGWALSEKTRVIIEGQSGRYWECQPDNQFVQAQLGLASSDCVQLLIYHELTKTLAADGATQQTAIGRQVAISSYLIKQEQRARNKDVMDNESAVVACYRDRSNRTVNLEQAGNMRALMIAWRDRQPNQRDLLGYVMGSAAYETMDFRTRSQSLLYTSADQILRRWGQAELKDVPAADVERLYVGHPQALAEKLYGGRNGNGRDNGDGWKYRGRGLAFVTFKEGYEKFGKAVQMRDLVDEPNLIFIPEINAKIFVMAYFPDSGVGELAKLVKANDSVGARLKVRQAAMGRQLHDNEKASETEHAARVWEYAQLFNACLEEASKKAN